MESKEPNYLELHNMGKFPPEYGKPRSAKQNELMTWYKGEHDTLVCNGTIRSGKTYSMSIAFIFWAMFSFKNKKFIMVGESIDTLLNNVVYDLRDILNESSKFGMKANLNITGKRLTVERIIKNKDGTVKERIKNIFRLFGGGVKGTEGKIQGFTSHGAFFDDATLILRNVYEQAVARSTTVENARFWLNCNSGHPSHWIKKELIDKSESGEIDNVKVMYFSFFDNPVMTYKLIHRAINRHSGVFKSRFILNQWTISEGIIFRQFAENHEAYALKDTDKDGNIIIPRCERISVGIDWGDSASNYAFVAVGILPRRAGIVFLASEKHKASELENISKVTALIVEFIKKLIAKFGRVDSILCDHTNILIGSTRTALRDAGLRVMIDKAYKPKITERIALFDHLIAMGMLKYVPNECDSVVEALGEAVYDENKPDTWLDDMTSDIDTCDAATYAISDYMSQFATKSINRVAV